MRIDDVIRNRRSIGRAIGAVPREEIEELVELASWAPNHRLTQPWRFTVLAGEARERYGRFWAELRAQQLALAEEKRSGFIEGESRKPLRAPSLIVVSTRTDPDPVVATEDFAATAAAVQNFLLASTARGYASMWRTGDAAYSTDVKRYLGIDESDRIVAFVYLGREADVDSKPAARNSPPIHWMED
ncbi:MAG: nitroreductase family protein [Vulcanimicrobiaceae bacterium]